MRLLQVVPVCLLLLAQAAHAAEGERPRVGLVLSGGGARGAAHVGVLKVLDEMRVPVDAIAGTSMGAVVGGLYASGMTAAEIETLIRSLNWQDAFRDRPPREELGFRRKQDERNFLVRFALGVKETGFVLPPGLVQGQKLEQVLRNAALPVAEVQGFDRLPIPFRAIATDLETGQAVVMDSGDLVTAMRASMSAPGVFSPAQRDGRLLVDGGLVENLPIDTARAMGVDVLIVVDVSFPLYAARRADFADRSDQSGLRDPDPRSHARAAPEAAADGHRARSAARPVSFDGFQPRAAGAACRRRSGARFVDVARERCR